MAKILITDDDPSIRRLLKYTLEDLEDRGVELLTANNGLEALEIIKANKPELVFLDIMMPKMTGLEVCNTVKNILCLTDVYIIFLTAKGQELDLDQAEKAGADAYMTKPFKPFEILQKSLEVLGLMPS